MNTLKFIFLFEGRIGRESYWLGKFALLFISALVVGLSELAFDVQIIGLLWVLIALWLFFALQAKRWHDLDKSAALILVNLVPFIGPMWCGVMLGFIEGSVGPNRFGSDPLEPPDDGTEESGYGLLSKAGRLERSGRVPEAFALYEHITIRYAHTAAGTDAQMSIRQLQAQTTNIKQE